MYYFGLCLEYLFKKEENISDIEKLDNIIISSALKRNNLVKKKATIESFNDQMLSDLKKPGFLKYM